MKLDLFKLYKQAAASFWQFNIISYRLDNEHWPLISKQEQSALLNTLKFFAAGDLVVSKGLLEIIKQSEQIPYEAKLFYNLQTAVEDVHSLAYKDMLDLFTRFWSLSNQTPVASFLDSHQTEAYLNNKIAWINKWKDNDDLTELLLGLAATECILFSCSFAMIFHFKRKGYFPGLCEANEYISRDEGLHFQFGVRICEYFPPKNPQIITKIALEAFEIEKQFASFIFEKGSFIGLTSYQLVNYAQYITDFFLSSFNQPKHFNCTNPLPYMETISLEGKSNMFERKVTEYITHLRGDNTFTTNKDF